MSVCFCSAGPSWLCRPTWDWWPQRLQGAFHRDRVFCMCVVCVSWFCDCICIPLSTEAVSVCLCAGGSWGAWSTGSSGISRTQGEQGILGARPWVLTFPSLMVTWQPLYGLTLTLWALFSWCNIKRNAQSANVQIHFDILTAEKTVFVPAESARRLL